MELLKEPNCEIKQQDKFIQNEFLRLIYYYIKLEVCYNLNGNSKILEYIKKNNFNIEIFNNLIKSDIETIKSSTFVDLILLEYFKQTLMVSNGLLNKTLIKSIVMCTDYELVRKGSKIKLENKLLHIDSKESYNNLKQLIPTRNEEYKNSIREKRKIQKKLLKSSLPIIIPLIFFPSFVYGLFNIPPTKYKTITEIYTSLGEYKKEETYEIKLDNPETSMIKIYNEPYLDDGELTRVIDCYELTDFETTSDIEKYYTLNVSLLKPNESITTKVSDEDYKGAFKEITKVVQDENDSKITKAKLTPSEIKFIIGLSIMSDLLYFFLASLIYKSDFKGNFKELKFKKQLCISAKQELIRRLKQANILLETNNYTLNEALKLCDEIAYNTDYETLNPKYKEIIYEYKKIRSEHTDLEQLLKEKELKKILGRK